MISKKLYGLKNYFQNLINLFETSKLPKVLMFSGDKGQGKMTLAHHFVSYIFDKKNYNLTNMMIEKSNILFNDLKENYNQNIIYFNCKDNNVKIENIRKLRIDLQKTSINNLPRFIIFDDVEYLNENCINAILKTIEEPTQVNYFILINNRTQKILDTLKSRSIEIRIFLKNIEKSEVISKIITDFKIKENISLKDSNLTPGNYLNYTSIINDEKIEINNDLTTNIEKLIRLYKTKKNIDFLNFAIYLINQFYFKKSKSEQNIDYYNDKRVNIIKKMHMLNKLNLNNKNLIAELKNYI